MVEALHSAFGTHHARAVHAKGTLLEGSFTPSATAATLSKAAIFKAASMPVTVRFSDFTGIPEIPDNIGDASPRGFAIKFRPEKGEGMDIVGQSFNGFQTATADEFAVLLRAIGASGPASTKPTALDDFLGSHPVAKTFLTTQKPPPVSYATMAYFGVNAFKFIDSKGHSQFVRYQFVPLAGEHYLDAEVIKAKGPDYLQQEIRTRVKNEPIVFDWYAQISGAGDAIDNPSIAWPDRRKQVKLGTIRIDRMVVDQGSTDKATMFLPGNVPEGIEPADPMIPVRSSAYPISFGERQ
jgi:catalase